jgi:hypothetical protein
MKHFIEIKWTEHVSKVIEKMNGWASCSRPSQLASTQLLVRNILPEALFKTIGSWPPMNMDFCLVIENVTYEHQWTEHIYDLN